MNFIDYLKTLDDNLLYLVYGSSWAVRGILQSLPPLAQQYLLRLLPVNMISHETFLNWLTPNANDANKYCIQLLTSLKIIEIKSINQKNKELYVIMNKDFQSSLKSTIFQISDNLYPEYHNQNGEKKDNTDLEVYTTRTWESILVFISNPKNTIIKIPESIKKLLDSAGLIDKKALQTTELGYRFLLADIHTQVWYILRGYIKEREAHIKVNQILDILFQLSALNVGTQYVNPTTDQYKNTVINDMRIFGLIYKDKASVNECFVPTSLVKNLSVDNSGSSDGKSINKGWIIMETNYKVYAYTESPLDIFKLELFCCIDYRLPNLVVATIDRDNIRGALIKGITGKQIVDFLHKNAHPKMFTKFPVVPSTLRDQIFSWEKERHRLRFTEGVLCCEFQNDNIFKSVLLYAQKRGYVIWHNSKSIFIHQHGVDDVRNYEKDLRN